jgi:predicted Zn finger-like uncharacterized protein
MSFPCPHCSTPLRVTDKRIGRKVRCLRCVMPVVIPPSTPYRVSQGTSEPSNPEPDPARSVRLSTGTDRQNEPVQTNFSPVGSEPTPDVPPGEHCSATEARIDALPFAVKQDPLDKNTNRQRGPAWMNFRGEGSGALGEPARHAEERSGGDVFILKSHPRPRGRRAEANGAGHQPLA